MKIAIDGPSGAGKSTISKCVAAKLGFVYIDTGAMYRTIGLSAVNNKFDTKKDIESIIKMLDEINIDISLDASGQRMYLNGNDVTDLIRTPEVSAAASDVAVIPEVRIKLVELQRKLAEGKNVIMDGRDIATYVLPDAEIKIFLTASAESRAERRYKELLSRGISTTFEQVLIDVNNRDENDSKREFSPLKVDDNAKIIDTTGNSLEESITVIKEFIIKEMSK
ncbi:MAG: (d)CMP kinase [Clostridia bacterium]|nr:(d)CMP kinase [Clostridia bacterium]